MPDHVLDRRRAHVVRGAVFVALALVAVAARADLASGIAAYASGSYRHAFRELRPLAQEGSAIAQVFVGAMYLEGNGVPRDPATAIRWYRRAAEQGHSGAQFRLAELYAAGVDVAADEAEADHWLRLAALNGHADAQYILGRRREAESGSRTADPVALRWYRKAAANGHLQARQRLAELDALGPLPGALRQPPPPTGTRLPLETAIRPEPVSAVRPAAPIAPVAKTPAVEAQVIAARAVDPRPIKEPVVAGVVAVAAPAPPPGAAAPGAPAAGGAGDFAVQLGSFRRESVARRELEIIRGRYGQRLGSLGTYVESADLGGELGTWHRLRAGPVTDFAAAQDLCADLRGTDPQQGCLPVRLSPPAD